MTWNRVLARIDAPAPRRFLLIAAGLAALALLPAIIGCADINNDAATYYLRLGGAAARGDWPAAFFHMIPPLFPLAIGAVHRLGFELFTAGKIASSLFFLAGVPAVYLLVRALGAERTARWAAILYIVSPRLLRYGGNAGPDAAKATLLLYMVLCAVWYLRAGRRGWLALAAACGALVSLARSECLLFAPLVGLAPLLRWWWGRRPDAVPVRAGRALADLALAAVVCVAVLAPWAAWQRRTIGYWLTDSRQLRVLYKAHLIGRAEIAPYRKDMALEGVTRNPRNHAVLRPLNEGLKGLVYPYVGLAAVGIVTVWRRRGWRWHDTLCAGLVLINFLTFAVVSGYVTKRYQTPVQPFILGWAAEGFLALGGWLAGRTWRGAPALAGVALLAFLAACLWDGTLEARPSLSAEKRAEAAQNAEIVAWLQAQRPRLRDPARPLPRSSVLYYHDGSTPMLMSATGAELAFRARCGRVPVGGKHSYSPDALLALCRQEGVDALLVDLYVTKGSAGVLRPGMANCPGLDILLADPALFREEQTWLRPGGGGRRLYRFLGQTPAVGTEAP